MLTYTLKKFAYTKVNKKVLGDVVDLFTNEIHMDDMFMST